MGFFFPNVDAIYLFKRAGTSEDPFLPINQELTVRYSKVTLKEIPDFITKVAVFGSAQMTEVTSEDIGANEYRVDYSTGIVYFNVAQEDITFNFSYMGIGQLDIPASRMIVNTSDTNSEGVTVQDILDAHTEIIDVNKLLEENKLVKLADFDAYKAEIDAYLHPPTYTFTATANNTTHITHTLDYNPTTDSLTVVDVSYVETLKKGTDYVENSDNRSIDLINGLYINIGEQIKFTLRKGVK